MNEEVLVLSASKYDFLDEKTNRAVKGLTVWLVPLKSQGKDNINGNKPIKYSLPSEKMFLFEQVKLPCYATMNFTFDFSREKIIPDTFTDLVEYEFGVLS